MILQSQMVNLFLYIFDDQETFTQEDSPDNNFNNDNNEFGHINNPSCQHKSADY